MRVQFLVVEPDGQTGNRIAAARKHAHLSQGELAAELRVSIRTVQNYEAGKFVPYRHLDALSRLLGRTPSWLLYGEEKHDVSQLLAKSRQQRGELQKNVNLLLDQLGRLAHNASLMAKE